jgi:hypothetical protein
MTRIVIAIAMEVSANATATATDIPWTTKEAKAEERREAKKASEASRERMNTEAMTVAREKERVERNEATAITTTMTIRMISTLQHHLLLLLH